MDKIVEFLDQVLEFFRHPIWQYISIVVAILAIVLLQPDPVVRWIGIILFIITIFLLIYAYASHSQGTDQASTARKKRNVIKNGVNIIVFFVIFIAITADSPLPDHSVSSGGGKLTPQTLLAQIKGRQPQFVDPLTHPSASQWDANNNCAFNGGAYHVKINQSGFFVECFAQTTKFYSFVYQVQMTTLQGDGGGLTMRSNNIGIGLRISPDGSYDIGRQVGGRSGAIRTGLNQTNTLTAIVSGGDIYMYVNGEYLGKVKDTFPSTVLIGLFAIDFSHSADAAFSNLKVWKIP